MAAGYQTLAGGPATRRCELLADASCLAERIRWGQAAGIEALCSSCPARCIVHGALC